MKADTLTNTAIDIPAVARKFGDWLVGEGPHWDDTMAIAQPNMKGDASEEDWYVFEHCVETGMCSDDLEPGSPEWKAVLRQWCQERAELCGKRLEAMAATQQTIHAHRLISCEEHELRGDLGVYWCYDTSNWDDPQSPWGDHDKPRIMVEALIPAAAVDWETSCLALMSWMRGDMEQELRVKAGYPVEVLSLTNLDTDTTLAVPDIEFRT